jgi:hypothetical protein
MLEVEVEVGRVGWQEQQAEQEQQEQPAEQPAEQPIIGEITAPPTRQGTHRSATSTWTRQSNLDN